MIRKAERGDAGTLLSLIDALADYEKLDRPTAEAKERLVNDGWHAQNTSNNPRFSAWLAEIPDPEDPGATRAVAYAITFETYSSFLALPTLYLEDLFVLPDYRRAGIGSQMLKHLVEVAKQSGCGRVEWVVLDWNTSAQDFYKKHEANHLTEWHHYRIDLV